MSQLMVSFPEPKLVRHETMLSLARSQAEYSMKYEERRLRRQYPDHDISLIMPSEEDLIDHATEHSAYGSDGYCNREAREIHFWWNGEAGSEADLIQLFAHELGHWVDGRKPIVTQTEFNRPDGVSEEQHQAMLNSPDHRRWEREETYADKFAWVADTAYRWVKQTGEVPHA